MHMVSYVEDRYKITVHEGRDYGELYDLVEDNGEHNNLWNDHNYKNLKAEMLFKFLSAEIKKDRKNSFDFVVGDYPLNVNIPSKIGTILDKSGKNLWNDSEYIDIKIDILLKAISSVIGSRPMWMPRIAGA